MPDEGPRTRSRSSVPPRPCRWSSACASAIELAGLDRRPGRGVGAAVRRRARGRVVVHPAARARRSRRRCRSRRPTVAARSGAGGGHVVERRRRREPHGAGRPRRRRGGPARRVPAARRAPGSPTSSTRPAGSRPTPTRDRVNLAAPVADGERVYVLRRGEAVGARARPAGPPPTGGHPDAARATRRRPRSSTSTPPPPRSSTRCPASVRPPPTAIIDYRTEHGPFTSVDELLDVRGIGDAKLAELRDRVTV